MPSTFTVRGTYGALICQTGTGLVLSYDREGGHDPEGTLGEYADIFRVDVAEYASAYPAERSGPDPECDILDIGFWTREGAYVGAEEEYRQIAAGGDDGCLDLNAA